MRALFFVAFALFTFLLGACSERSATERNDEPHDMAVTDGGVDLGPTSDCAEEARWIYLVDADDTLLRYEPDADSLTPIGPLGCSSEASPYSMAVSRDATAYVLYTDGRLYRVSTLDASCAPTIYEPGTEGFQLFGMGFVSNDAGGSTETLFIARQADPITGRSALAKLSTDDWRITVVGDIDGSGELTGNGAGELWGFFPDVEPMSVRHLDKVDGVALDTFDVSAIDDPALASPRAWAFAFWGGRYYMFYMGLTGTSSGIFRLTPDTREVTTVRASTGRTIVGAGVSTCAPVVLL